MWSNERFSSIRTTMCSMAASSLSGMTSFHDLARHVDKGGRPDSVLDPREPTVGGLRVGTTTTSERIEDPRKVPDVVGAYPFRAPLVADECLERARVRCIDHPQKADALLRLVPPPPQIL